ncbi:unnamed protein product, partial [Ectocarpus sp. 6 AP-2014]
MMSSSAESNKRERGQSIVVREIRSPSAGGGRAGGDISEIAFSADGAHLLTGAKNLAVRIWGTRSGEVELLAPPLAGSNEDGGYHAGHLSCDIVLHHPSRGMLMAAGGATGGVLVWDCCGPSTGSDGSSSGGSSSSSSSSKEGLGTRPTSDLRNNGHEYGVPVCHLAAYPDGSFFVSADTTTLKA